jgi:DNA polymerase type B, organellar and viral
MDNKANIPHFIQTTSGNDRPHNIVFFDTETTAQENYETGAIHKLKLGVAQYYRTIDNNNFRLVSEIVFTNPDEFADYIEAILRDKITLYLISHNLTFDLLAGQLFITLPEHDIELINFYSKGTTTIFKYRKGSSKITAIDLANFMPVKLETIGSMVHRPKMEIDFETCTDDYLTQYCRNDVLVMVDAIRYWIDFLDQNNLGSFKYTIASTAFNIFRYRFMNHKIYIHKNLEVLALEDKAYHGGRVEATRIGFFNSDTYYKIDINSMYPYVCSVNKYPVSLYHVYSNPSLKQLTDKLTNYAVIADVLLNTTEPAYPLLYDNKLIYPIGNFRTVLSTPELIHAMQHGYIQKVFKMSVYQRQNIFEEYMKFFYNLRIKYRKTGNETFDKIGKMLMNSLYGKFGQKAIDTKIIGHTYNNTVKIENGYNLMLDAPYTHYYLNDTVFEAIRTGYSYNSFPAIAGHVTAYARMYLYELQCIAGHSNVFYKDTDSLFVNSEGYRRLEKYISNDKLGFLKVEEICDWIEILCPKNYRTPQTDKHKGIRKNAIEFEENRFVQEQFSGLNGMLHVGRLDGTYIHLVEKHLSMKITHGYEPDENGYVQPFIMTYINNENVQVLEQDRSSLSDYIREFYSQNNDNNSYT